MPLSELIARFHRPSICRKACSNCCHYGRQWSCPPFDVEPIEGLRCYSKATVLAVEIPVPDGTPANKAREIMNPFHKVLAQQALDIERITGGRASCTTGRCRICAQTCTRVEGKPCRCPELMRPSPEAMGFDLESMLHELLDIDLEWAADDTLPSRLYLIGAVFHD